MRAEVGEKVKVVWSAVPVVVVTRPPSHSSVKAPAARVTGSEKVTLTFVVVATLVAPSPGVVEVTEGAPSTVVKVMLIGAVSVSGGSPASTSVMSAATADRVQVAVCGRSPVGLTVTVDVPEPVTAYGRSGPPQASVKAPEATSTGSLKLSTTLVDVATPTASPTGVEETR